MEGEKAERGWRGRRLTLRSHQKMHLLPERVDAKVLRRGKSSFAAQQKFCGAAKLLRRSKGFDAQQKKISRAAKQFCSAASFARGASEFIHNHGRHYEHCMSLPVVEEGETSECTSFMGS